MTQRQVRVPEERTLNEHAPRVGRFGRLAGGLHPTSTFWWRVALGVARIPSPLQFVMVGALAHMTWVFYGNLRRSLERNVQQATELDLCWLERKRRGRRALVQFGWCVLERNESLLPTKWHQFDYESVGVDHWHAAMAGGRPVIVVTAHVGGWEVGSLRPVAEERRTVHIVREEERTEELQDAFARALAARGVTDYVTHFAAGNADLGLELLAALRGGGVVCLQGDRPRVGGGVVEGELFGEPYAFPEGPFLLARMAGAILLPVFNVRTGRRTYRMRICAPIEPTRTADRAQDLAVLSRAYAAELEHTLLEAPEQWFRLRFTETELRSRR